MLPTDGPDGFVLRVLVWLALPVLLLTTGFLSAQERRVLRSLLRPSVLRERLRALRAAQDESSERSGSAGAPEIYEQVARDEDRL